MNPRVVFIAGPLKGSDFELGEEALSVGRDSTNDVRLADSLLSRRHCRVGRAGERFVLTDLESLNGTFVNGRPVREHTLADGDRVAVGESCFVFLSGEGESQDAPSNLVTLSDRHMQAHSTVRLKAGEALYLRPPERAARGFSRGPDGYQSRCYRSRSVPCHASREHPLAATPSAD
jgi:predicted component of type VI protein secretion system